MSHKLYIKHLGDKEIIISGKKLELEWIDSHALVIWTHATERERLLALSKTFIQEKRGSKTT